MTASKVMHRYWFVGVMIVVALLLGIGQFAWFLAFDPSLVQVAAGSALSTMVLFGFACILLRVRRRLADLRYRWRTREVDREMRRTRR